MGAEVATILAATACRDTSIALERALVDAGIMFEFVKTSREARERICKNSISMVLADMSLSGGGGVALAKYANQVHPGMPVMLILDPVRRETTHGYPAITKPVDAVEVVTLIQQALGARSIGGEVVELRKSMTEGFAKVHTQIAALNPVQVLWDAVRSWKLWSVVIPLAGIFWWLLEEPVKDYWKALRAVPAFEQKVTSLDGVCQEVLQEQKALRRDLPFLLRSAPMSPRTTH